MIKSSQDGFTLLEVIMTIVILLTLTMAATSVIRSSIDLRQALSHQVQVSHGINAVMQRVVRDVEAIFILSNKRQEYNPGTRSTKTAFQRESNGTLRMTTMSHRPIKAGSPESDQTFVVYELRDDRDHSGRKNLYRGEAKVIPQRLKDDIPMSLFAKGIVAFEVIPWTGQKWSESRWNSGKSEHRNMLPRMMRIHIEMLEVDEDDPADKRSADEIPTSTLTTVVYLPKSWGLKEYKPYSGSLKWN